MKKHLIRKTIIASAVLAATMTISAFAYNVQGGTVKTSSSLNMRSGPSTSTSVITQLANGARVAIIGQDDVWYKVASGGVVGYVHSDYVEAQAVMNIEAGGAKVTTAVLNMRSEPNTSSSIVTRLTEGTVANITGINSGWFKVTSGSYTGYVHPDYIEVVASSTSSRNTASGAASSTGASADRQEILDYADQFLGVKYVYGGSSPSGFDCSGFTKYVFAHFDISLARTSSSQYSSSVKKIERSELQPGDLVFFCSSSSSSISHVGIYAGNNQFIHSPSPGKVVQYDDMSSGYYDKYYVGAGTVLS